ncbi:MAG: DUF4442 domain-containing protein [Bdellovibrionaceae bacterium]|nr:DUF4442 domain-containing protein [Pseudobdellovibrionaceae bacterium]
MFEKIISPTWKVRSFGLLKIPLIFIVSPKVLTLNSEECKIKIPLNRITRNHAHCMYFGALSIGADLAGGLLAMEAFGKHPINFLFKDINGQFLKRCESDAIFYCQQGADIKSAVEEALQSKERVHIPLDITVYAPDTLGDEPCAKFRLTLSIKVKNKI